MEPMMDRSDSTDERSEIRNCLLTNTIELFLDEGPGALSLRKLADECDTSTQMIYTIFGGKSGLLDELYELGAELLGDRCREVSNELSPRDRLFKLMEVYREFALEIDQIYDVMFTRSMTDQSIVRRTDVFEIFHGAVKDCINDGVLEAENSEALTESLWAAAHGVISLEIAGYYEEGGRAQERYFDVINAVINGYRER